MSPSVLSLSLNELSAGLREREFSCEELCRFYLERIGKYGMRDALNCVMAVNPMALDEARMLDRGGPEGLPFYGLCVLLKDNIDVKGMATTAGSEALHFWRNPWNMNATLKTHRRSRISGQR